MEQESEKQTNESYPVELLTDDIINKHKCQRLATRLNTDTLTGRGWSYSDPEGAVIAPEITLRAASMASLKCVSLSG